METKKDTRYYKVAGVTIKVTSDLPIREDTFHPKFSLFETSGPGDDTISIHHHFESHKTMNKKSWKKVYDKSPWVIYHSANGWIYKRIHRFRDRSQKYCTAFFSQNHSHADVYNEPIGKENYKNGSLDSLTLFPTDQVLLARILADRNGCFFHSNGVVLKNKGSLFLGHSGHGKSTIAKMLEARGGKIICDDRVIVQKTADKINMHGSWCHGKESIFSADTSPLDAIFFLTQSTTNEITASNNYNHNVYQLISFIIKPLATRQWWENNFNLIESIVKRIPCYNLKFNKQGGIVDLIEEL